MPRLCFSSLKRVRLPSKSQGYLLSQQPRPGTGTSLTRTTVTVHPRKYVLQQANRRTRHGAPLAEDSPDAPDMEFAARLSSDKLAASHRAGSVPCSELCARSRVCRELICAAQLGGNDPADIQKISGVSVIHAHA